MLPGAGGCDNTNSKSGLRSSRRTRIAAICSSSPVRVGLLCGLLTAVMVSLLHFADLPNVSVLSHDMAASNPGGAVPELDFSARRSFSIPPLASLFSASEKIQTFPNGEKLIFTVVIPVRYYPISHKQLAFLAKHPAVDRIFMIAIEDLSKAITADLESDAFLGEVGGEQYRRKIDVRFMPRTVVTQSVSRTLYIPTFGEMVNVGMRSARDEVAGSRNGHYLLSLSQSHVPRNEDFLTALGHDIVSTVNASLREDTDPGRPDHAESAVIAGCTSLQQQPDKDALFIVDQGLVVMPSTNPEDVPETAQWDEADTLSQPNSFVFARLLNGFPSVDRRITHRRRVVAVTPYCLAMPMHLFRTMKGFKTTGKVNLLTDVARGVYEKKNRGPAAQVVPKLIFTLERAVSQVESEYLMDSRSSLLIEAVRDTFDLTSKLILAWQMHSGKSIESLDRSLYHIPEIPTKPQNLEKLIIKTFNDAKHAYDALALPPLPRGVRKRLRVPQGLESLSLPYEEDVGIDLSLRAQTAAKNSHRVACVIATTATVLVDTGSMPTPLTSFGKEWRVHLLTLPAFPLVGSLLDDFGQVIATHAAAIKVKADLQNNAHQPFTVRNSKTTASFDSSLIQETVTPKSAHKGLEMKPPVHVLWNHYCCHCCGFSTEISHFVWPLLQQSVNVSLMTKQECFCQGAPAAMEMALNRSYYSTRNYIDAQQRRMEIRERDDRNQLPVNYPVTIWIEHNDPSSLLQDVLRQHRPEYLVSRSMYEFTLLDTLWVDSANEYADEVWVPAETVKKNFITSGVKPELIHIVPEAVDTYVYDPDVQPKMELPYPKWPTWCNKPRINSGAKPFRFLSDFKWEPRKGWDLLFKAYYHAFGASAATNAVEADVELHILTHIWYPDVPGDPHNVTHLKQEIKRHVLQPLKLKEFTDLPRFCIVLTSVPEESVPRLYNSVDAFVLPTKGEGWGLPSIQAMAMALPVISTNIGGQMEYMKHWNSFLIPLSTVEEIPKDSVYRWREGKKWGEPSLSGTTKLMRLVYDHREYARRVGKVARKHIVDHFSEDAVMRKLQTRLDEIRDIVVQRRNLHY